MIKNDYLAHYGALNSQQKQAVDAIDGPLLVIAGPGTGKTELLSVRVAHILQSTDTLSQNILCLTFSESGANAMRERLAKMIGNGAYEVTISTYHAFGSDLIRRFPEYFLDLRLENPIDDIGRYEIISSIVDGLPYDSPLKQSQYHLGDLISTISEVKRSLLTQEDLAIIHAENEAFINNASNMSKIAFSNFTTMPRKCDEATVYFEKLLEKIKPLSSKKPFHEHYMSLANLATLELENALLQSDKTQKTTPLTKWKNAWLVKNSENEFVFNFSQHNARIKALGNVIAQYENILNKKGLYDYDDMILHALHALKQNNDLKYTLQEQYLYILLDEFQDTNPAQLELVHLLSDNPVHEGRPNIMAVGDDDQAIYAFQGAQYSNMSDYVDMYRNVAIVNLSENYRSHKDVLHIAKAVSESINERLHDTLDGINKPLVASGVQLPPKSEISQTILPSESQQYAWVAESISKLLSKGVSPNDIAVLAPKHKYLEILVPYLHGLNIPVNYDKRENILDQTIIQQIIEISRLLLAINDGDDALANSLWPKILSYPFWDISVQKIWKLSWKINDERKTNWSEELLNDTELAPVTEFLLTLALRVDSARAEEILDQIMGTNTNETENTKTSPMYGYYFENSDVIESNDMYQTMTYLSVIRARLREHQLAKPETITLSEFVNFIDLYSETGQPMLNTSPHIENTDAVNLMTVYKAKGLEFSHVYLTDCLENVWGDTSRSNSNRLTLTPNLAPIRYAGQSRDERLRLLFVAMTRAKYGLHFSSYTQTTTGKNTTPLGYLLGLGIQQHETTPNNAINQSVIIENTWHEQHTNQINNSSIRALLTDRLSAYQLSPTHLNKFIDVEHGGPEKFFYNSILRFPSAPTSSGQFGNAIHETLEWMQLKFNTTNKTPAPKKAIEYFKQKLQSKYLSSQEFLLLENRGIKALDAFLQQRINFFNTNSVAELNFKHEGVIIGDSVHLGGKIDRLEIDKKNKSIAVVDYKTGTPHSKWDRSVKLHKYRQQLYCYKLLVESSTRYKGYTVTSGRLEFIEPDSQNKIHTLDLTFTDTELNRTIALLESTWKHIQDLDFPNISSYPSTIAGCIQFEDDLIKKYQP